MSEPLATKVTPYWEELVRRIRREGTPARVHYIELFLGPEVQEAVWQRFDLQEGLDPDRPDFPMAQQLRIQRFLGYDYVRAGLEGLDWPFNRTLTGDTAALERADGRSYMDERNGPITTWEELESYPWPSPCKATSRALDRRQ